MSQSKPSEGAMRAGMACARYYSLSTNAGLNMAEIIDRECGIADIVCVLEMVDRVSGACGASLSIEECRRVRLALTRLTGDGWKP